MEAETQRFLEALKQSWQLYFRAFDLKKCSSWAFRCVFLEPFFFNFLMLKKKQRMLA